MAGLEAIAKPWTDSNGKTRWYVNDWFQYIGITKKVERYFGGPCGHYKRSFFYYKDEQLYSWWVDKYIAKTKVWIDDDLKVHVRLPGENTNEYNPIPDLEARIINAVQDVAYCYA